MRFTLDDIRNSPAGKLNQHLFEDKLDKPKKGSKYHNKKTVVDGIEFDSIREAKRYGELKMLLKAGKIGLLELQVEYELNEGGSHSLKYIADFRYWDCEKNLMVVEDCKGCRTAVYKKKKRLMKKLFGITILET